MLFTKFYCPFLVGISHQLYTRGLTAWLVTIGCSVLWFRVLSRSFLFCRIVWLLPPTKQSNKKLNGDEHGELLVMLFSIMCFSLFLLLVLGSYKPLPTPTTPICFGICTNNSEFFCYILLCSIVSYPLFFFLLMQALKHIGIQFSMFLINQCKNFFQLRKHGVFLLKCS